MAGCELILTVTSNTEITVTEAETGVEIEDIIIMGSVWYRGAARLHSIGCSTDGHQICLNKSAEPLFDQMVI